MIPSMTMRYFVGCSPVYPLLDLIVENGNGDYPLSGWVNPSREKMN